MSLHAWIEELGGQLAGAAERDVVARPRRGSLLVVAALVVAVVLAVAVGGARDSEREAVAPSPSPTATPEGTVPSGRVLETRPYMGVACPVPNSIACDRVGLDIDLREPAIAVEARIGDRTFALDDEEWSGPRGPDGEREHFAGFLQPAGLAEPGPLGVAPDADGRWFGGEGPGLVPVELIITRPGGARERTEVKLHLAAGWG